MLFVNELRCLGRGACDTHAMCAQRSHSAWPGCSSCCVDKAPRAFAFAEDTGAARVIAQGTAGEYELREAVGQCPTECIHHVTPHQLVVLEAQLLRCALMKAHTMCVLHDARLA